MRGLLIALLLLMGAGCAGEQVAETSLDAPGPSDPARRSDPVPDTPSNPETPTAPRRADDVPVSDDRTGLIVGRVEGSCAPDNPYSGQGQAGGDGCFDPAAGVPGVIVNLKSEDGQLIASTTSGEDGSFELVVSPGTYLIEEAQSGNSQLRTVREQETIFVTLVVR